MANCYQYYRHVPLAQRIARWTSNPKVLGSIPRWDETFFSLFLCFQYMLTLWSNTEISFLSVVVITCASHAQGRRFEPGRKQYFLSQIKNQSKRRFYGVMVSTLDFESSDPSSNLGRTLFIYLFMYFFVLRQSKRLRGATVARLTPDQKAACSNHVGVIIILFI